MCESKSTCDTGMRAIGAEVQHYAKLDIRKG